MALTRAARQDVCALRGVAQRLAARGERGLAALVYYAAALVEQDRAPSAGLVQSAIMDAEAP